MLDIGNLTQDNILYVKAPGRITTDDIAAAEAKLTELLKDGKKFRVLADGTEIDSISAEALLADLRAAFRVFSRLHQIERIAIVSDLEWVHVIARVEGHILPVGEIRPFHADARDAAEAWLHAPLPTADNLPQDAPSCILSDQGNNLYRLDVTGYISEQDVENILPQLRELAESDDSFRLLTVIRDWRGFAPAVMVRMDMMQLKFKLMHKLERYALVGGPSWAVTMVTGLAPLMKMEMRHFESSEETAAIDWVSQDK